MRALEVHPDFPITPWTWLHDLAPPSAWVRGKTWRNIGVHSLPGHGMWAHKGCRFFSCDFTARDLSMFYMWGCTSVSTYVPSGERGGYIHVQHTWGWGLVSMEWAVCEEDKEGDHFPGARLMRCNRVMTRWEKVQFVPQQLQLSAEGLALSFLSSFMGSGNSLYSSTSVSCLRALRAIVWNACSTLMASLALVS